MPAVFIYVYIVGPNTRFAFYTYIRIINSNAAYATHEPRTRAQRPIRSGFFLLATAHITNKKGLPIRKSFFVRGNCSFKEARS